MMHFFSNNLLIIGGDNLAFFETNVLGSYFPNTYPSATITLASPIVAMASYDDSLFYVSEDSTFVHYSILKKSPIESHQFSSVPLTLVNFPDSDLMILSTNNGEIYFYNNSQLEHRFNVNSKLGKPMSLSGVKNSTHYVIGTNEGMVLLFDLRMQSLVSRFHFSNFPAKVSQSVFPEFSVSSGPFGLTFNYALNEIKKCFSIPPLILLIFVQ